MDSDAVESKVTQIVDFGASCRSNIKTSKQMDHIALSMAKAKRCVVITGAGISVSAGIPVDFIQILFTQS